MGLGNIILEAFMEDPRKKRARESQLKLFEDQERIRQKYAEKLRSEAQQKMRQMLGTPTEFGMSQDMPVPLAVPGVGMTDVQGMSVDFKPGEGLLGVLDKQYHLPAKTYVDMMGIPGQEKMGSQGLMNIFDQMNKKYEPYTMSEGQSRFVGSELIATAPKNYQAGKFDNYKDYLAAQADLREKANKALAASRESLRKHAQVTERLKQKGGFDNLTGADDTLLVKAYASMLLPGEAVMSDDVRVIAEQSGLPATLRSMAMKVAGKGSLSVDERQRIYESMTTLADMANNENQEIRNLYGNDIRDSGFKEGSIFRPSLYAKPYVSPALPGVPSKSSVPPPPPPGAKKVNG